jgi:hypothetical protein
MRCSLNIWSFADWRAKCYGLKQNVIIFSQKTVLFFHHHLWCDGRKLLECGSHGSFLNPIL